MQFNKLHNFLEKYWLLILILLLAAFLRLYKIDSVPPSPSLDEVSIGYNSFSILKTGKDEYGNRLPILLRAYDDYRPALYVYFVIPFVQLLGLTVASVRLPSVIFSMLTLLAAYLIAAELFSEEKYFIKINRIKLSPGLAAAAILAISPWHIYLSRLGHEVNLGLLFIVAAMYAWILFIKRKKTIFLYACAVIFAFSFYTYQSQKLLTPFLIIVIALLYKKVLWKFKKDAFLAGIIACLLSLPMILASLSPGGLIRFQATSVFSGNLSAYDEAAHNLLIAKTSGNIIGQVWYSHKVTGFRIVAANYLSHFQPSWLFWGRAREDHKVPNLGLLYWWEAPFIILGFIFLIKSQIDRKLKILLLLWFFSAPLPASITTQAPHAMRAFTFLPLFQIFGSFGIIFLGIFLTRVRTYYFLVLGIIVLWSIGYFYHQYFFEFPVLHSSSFQYALAKAIFYERQNDDKYKKIIFSNQNNLYQSYMFYLFFSRYDPNQYQKEGGTKSGGFAESHMFGKYEFRPIDWAHDSKEKNILFIGNISDFPTSAPLVGDIPNLDGTPAVRIVSL